MRKLLLAQNKKASVNSKGSWIKRPRKYSIKA